MRDQLRDRERLIHIMASIERIERYTHGKTFNDMIEDDMMYYAIVKNIEMIGEAANMLTHEFQAAHSSTLWRMVKGMRNYIVHEYFQIDNTVVWDVVTNDLSTLKSQIKDYIDELS